MAVHRRQPLPRLWLMTDERIADLDAAIATLPRGAGIIFRHYTLPPRARRRLFEAIRRTARARRLMLVLADRPAIARQWGADGAHERSARASPGIRTMAVHSVRERIVATRAGADLIFVSPVCRTRSHPAAKPIGRIGFLRIAGPLRHRAIMLGGMNAVRFRTMTSVRPYGWAAIDALSPSKR
jgi:thiamine-phosphate pyrophosphorylase